MHCSASRLSRNRFRATPAVIVQIAVRRSGGLAVRRFGGSAVRRFGGSAVRRFGGSAAKQSMVVRCSACTIAAFALARSLRHPVYAARRQRPLGRAHRQAVAHALHMRRAANRPLTGSNTHRGIRAPPAAHRLGSPSRTSLTAAHRGNNRRPRMREAAHRARRSHPNRFVRN
ncbi:hypothetical protein ACX83H_30455 [Burkholderia pseudomallei]|uniref:hypothetical protein n=2 Tax=Burkholderia pseudomallei TaxID=28450 RepID=UPI001604B934|nr:hypothetical protein [Burkholderia pseudomallei]